MVDKAMGSIMRATAVLLIHMESSAEARRNAAMMEDCRVPATRSRQRASLVWRWQRSIPCAMSMPPKNKKITGFAKGAVALAMPQTPSKGKSTSGNIAVTANGVASDTHKEAMSTATPKVRHPSNERPAGGFMSRTKTSEATPEKGTASFNHDPADMFFILPCRSARASLQDDVGVGSSP